MKKFKQLFEKYDYSSTQFNLYSVMSNIISSYYDKRILDEMLYTEDNDGSYGIENNHHITVKYGLDITDHRKLIPIVEKFGSVVCKLGNVTHFEAEKYDVLKIDVISDDLIKLNKLIGDNLDCPGQTFSDYKPHCTIAYLKKGYVKQFIDNSYFKDSIVMFDTLIFSSKNGKYYEIKLN